MKKQIKVSIKGRDDLTVEFPFGLTGIDGDIILALMQIVREAPRRRITMEEIDGRLVLQGWNPHTGKRLTLKQIIRLGELVKQSVFH